MKRLSVKVGEFTNQQNETKGEYVKIGALGESQNGEYLLLDPTVNLAGVLQKQNALAVSQGKKANTSVMVSIFDDSQQQGNGQSQQRGSQQQQNGYQNNQNSAPPF